jgi:AcrR family transcriptional regulator
MTPKQREELLDRIAEIVSAEGFSDLRVGDLAKRLSCSRTTLYKLAPSKDELVLAICDRIADASYAEALQASSEPGLSQADRITRWLEVVTRRQGNCSLAFWRDVSEWEPSARLFLAKNERGVGHVQGFIEEGVRTGEFRPMHMRFVAEMISRGSRASRDPAVLEATGLDSGEAAAELGAFIVGGLRGR